MLVVFVWNTTSVQNKLLSNLINSTFGEETPSRIIDLGLGEEVDVETSDIVFACGIRCYNILKAKAPPEINIVKLLTPDKLTNQPENTLNRKKTFALLKGLSENKDVIAVPQEEFEAEDFKQFTLEQLKNLKKTLEIKGITHWVGTNQQGKKIAFVLDPTITIQNCHSVLTFEEVFIAKMASELLNITNFTIVKRDINESR